MIESTSSQIFILNGSALFAGIKSLESGAKALFGTDADDTRSKPSETLGSSILNTATAIFGNDSLTSRISNLVTCLAYGIGAYLLFDVSRQLSITEASIEKANETTRNQLVKSGFDFSSSTDQEIAERQIEACIQNNPNAEVSELCSQVEKLILHNIRLGSKAATAQISANTVLHLQGALSGLNATHNSETARLNQKIADLTEQAKCGTTKNLLAEVQVQLQAQLHIVASLRTQVTELAEQAKCLSLNSQLAQAKSESGEKQSLINSLISRLNTLKISLNKCKVNQSV